MMRRLVFYPAVGLAGTVLAAWCSLLADGVAAKRWTWVAVGLAVAVGAGLWRAWREGPDSDRP